MAHGILENKRFYSKNIMLKHKVSSKYRLFFSSNSENYKIMFEKSSKLFDIRFNLLLKIDKIQFWLKIASIFIIIASLVLIVCSGNWRWSKCISIQKKKYFNWLQSWGPNATKFSGLIFLHWRYFNKVEIINSVPSVQ